MKRRSFGTLADVFELLEAAIKLGVPVAYELPLKGYGKWIIRLEKAKVDG